MSQTRPAYVGSGIDWQQKEKMDMAQRMADLALSAAEQKAKAETQKQDLLQQWLNPPQNFAGQSDVPVNLGGFAAEQPGTGQTGPMQQVGIGPMGMIPAGNVTTPGPILAADQARKKEMAQRTLMGIPMGAELPQVAEERLFSREEHRRKLIAEEDRLKETAREERDRLKEIDRAITASKTASDQEKRTELVTISQEKRAIDARHNSTMNQILGDKLKLGMAAGMMDPKIYTSQLADIQTREREANRLRTTQIEDISRRELFLRDPERFRQYITQEEAAKKALYERFRRLRPEAQRRALEVIRARQGGQPSGQ